MQINATFPPARFAHWFKGRELLSFYFSATDEPCEPTETPTDETPWIAPMTDRVIEERREADLDVSPDVQWREVEYSEDGTGRTVYRHVIYTEWQVLPCD